MKYIAFSDTMVCSQVENQRSLGNVERTTVVTCAVPVSNLSWMLFQEGRSSNLRRGVGQAAHTLNNPHVKSKSKSVPLQAWSGSEGSRKLRFPDFVTTAQEGGKVVNLTHRPPLPPGNPPGTHFC
jgi:hypothetical protein